MFLTRNLYFIVPEFSPEEINSGKVKVEPLGFSIFVTDEQIERYSKLPIEERLRWLEEAAEFMYRVLTKEQWEILQRFRKGAI